MPDNIVVGSEKQIKSYIHSRGVDSGWKWCYLGVNIDRKEGLREVFTDSKRYRYAEDLRKVSGELKDTFLDWMSGINSRHKDDLKWWATRFASRSPFQTDFFLLFCYFNLIKRWAAGGMPADGYQLMVIVENPYLHRLLERHFYINKDAKVYVKPAILRLIFSAVFCFVKTVLVPFIFLCRRLLSRAKKIYFTNRFRSVLDVMAVFNADIMISTCIEEKSFKNGNFIDPYTGLLAEFYAKTGNKVVISSQDCLAAGLMEKALSSKRAFCLPEFYLKAGDWLKILFMRPPRMADENALFLNGVDYSFLYAGELDRERASMSFYSNLCVYFGHKNYFEKNRQLKLLIYLFENQPWEKMILMASRSVNSACLCAGYQHTTMPSMLLNYFLGKDEYEASPMPDYIVTNGPYNEKLFFGAGYKLPKVVNGGSLRYLSKPCRKQGPADRKAGAMNVVLLLTSSLPYSLEVIYGSRQVLNAIRDCKIYVKPHPDLFNRKIKKAIREVGGLELIGSGSMEEILSKMDAVVYSGTTAALEALCKGLLVYKIATELIDLDILEDLDITKSYAGDSLKTLHYNGDTAALFNEIIGEPVKEDVWLNLAGSKR